MHGDAVVIDGYFGGSRVFSAVGECVLSDCTITALSDTFPSSGRAIACTAVGAAGILGALNVLSANWQYDGTNYRSISGDFSVVVCLFGFCLAAACLWSMLAA